MSGKTYGYVRVSAKGQKEDRDLTGVLVAGIVLQLPSYVAQTYRVL